MTDSIHEQLSAFLDGELSTAESELLLKRVERDPELSSRLKRHMLVGDALRATQAEGPSRAFASRVASAINAESLPGRARWVANQWLKPVAGGAIAAGVAAMVLVSLQQSTISPGTEGNQIAAVDSVVTQLAEAEAPIYLVEALPELPAGVVSGAMNDTGADRYVVPVTGGNRVRPPIQVIGHGQLANYVVAHSEYSTLLGHRNVLTGLLSDELTERLVVESNDANAGSEAAGKPAADTPNSARSNEATRSNEAMSNEAISRDRPADSPRP